MKKKNRKNNLDEMQEQKLLHIERNCCWFCYWGLLISIMVQYFLYDGSDIFKYVAAEWIVFMCLCLYMGISCFKNGIWDRHYKPNYSTSIFFSGIAALAVGVIMFIQVYKRSNMLGGSIASGVFAGGFTFILCFVTFLISIKYFKKRVNKLENEIPESEES